MTKHILLLTAVVGFGVSSVYAIDPSLSTNASKTHHNKILSNSIEPKTRAFLESLNSSKGPQIYELPIDQARGVLTSVQAVDVPKLPADIEDRTLPVGPNGQVSVRIVRPQDASDTLPIVMYFHGGGWILGDENTHDRLIREIANGARAAVVFLKYSRSPEAKYPVAIEEAYAATKYLAENGQELKIDSSRLAVAGDSVGGNMATVVTLLSKERGGPKISHQLLFYPVTDANFENGSYNKFATNHYLSREAMKWFWNAYLPDKAKRKNPMASPLQASINQLKGLPPALVITAGYDVLRDEGEAYAKKLIEAGVSVTAVRFLGTIHDFILLNPIADTPAPRAAITLANTYLHQALAK